MAQAKQKTNPVKKLLFRNIFRGMALACLLSFLGQNAAGASYINLGTLDVKAGSGE